MNCCTSEFPTTGGYSSAIFRHTSRTGVERSQLRYANHASPIELIARPFGNSGSHTTDGVYAAAAACRAAVSTALRMERGEPVGASLERYRARGGAAPEESANKTAAAFPGRRCSPAGSESNWSDA